MATQGQGWRLPLPSCEELDQGNELRRFGEAERRLIRERAIDQPFGTTTQRLRLKNPARKALLSRSQQLGAFRSAGLLISSPWVRVRSHAHFRAGAFGGDEFTRCWGDFGGETLDRWCIVCGKDETADAVVERELRQLFGPLLRRSVEQGAT